MKKLYIIILMLVILIPFTSCKWLKEKGIFGRKVDTMAVWQAKQDSIRIADSLKAVQERMALENQRLEQERLAEQQRLEWERKYKYNIIVGSFITPEYARNCLADYQAKGYTNARIIPLENTRFEMVSAEAHDNFRTAVNRLKQFQDTVAFDAWLYIYSK